MPGILHAVGTGYIEPPKDEPWLLGSVPHDIQQYFDEIYNMIEGLMMVPCPKGKNSWNRTIQPYTWEIGSVCFVLSRFEDALLMFAN
jgi:hypothetical protein